MEKIWIVIQEKQIKNYSVDKVAVVGAGVMGAGIA